MVDAAGEHTCWRRWRRRLGRSDQPLTADDTHRAPRERAGRSVQPRAVRPRTDGPQTTTWMSEPEASRDKALRRCASAVTSRPVRP